ncbi:hypothetical protein HK101_005916 [Irineochytrium annulatum]|nr:hypothetical protein HK101_005916 [Irineochytrium annulatum]
MLRKRPAPGERNAIIQKILVIEKGREEAQERFVKELLLHQQRSLVEVLAFQERVGLQEAAPGVNDSATVIEWLEKRFEQLEGRMEKDMGALARKVEALAEELRVDRGGDVRDSGVAIAAADASVQRWPQFKRKATVATISDVAELSVVPKLATADALRDEAGVVVAHISDEYAASTNCRKEFQFAKKLGLKIVPVIVGYSVEEREAIAANYSRADHDGAAGRLPSWLRRMRSIISHQEWLQKIGGLFGSRKPHRPWEQTWLGMEISEELYIDARSTDNIEELYGAIIKTVRAELDRRHMEPIATSPSNVTNNIVDAVSSNDLMAVKRLLQNQQVLSMKYDEGQSILHIAVQRSALVIVKELVAADPSLIEAIDARGDTPLFDAVDFEKTDVVEFLLAEGADVRAQNSYGQTPLHLAANFEAISVASKLLDAKPDVNALDLRHETPLIIAAKQDRLQVMVELLKHGADVSTTDDDGNTPLILASRKGDAEMFNMLLKSNASLMQTNKTGETPLMACCASLRSTTSIVQKILDWCSQTIDAADNAGMTAIAYSVQMSNNEIFELLLGKAKIEVVTKNKWNLLHHAAKQSDTALAEKVFEQLKRTSPFSINAVTHRKRTALAIGAFHGRIHTVKFLLDNGADPFLPDVYNVEPVVSAINSDSVDVVKLLLDVIASRPGTAQHAFYLADNEARHALLLYASARESDQTAAYLAHRFNIPTRDASVPIPRPADATCARRRTLNPLHAASYAGNLPMISRLLAAGYFVDALDDHGNTALCKAVFGAQADAVSALLEAGADVALRNQNGDTAALHAARVRDHEAAVGIVQVLIAGGADVGVRGKLGRTPLHEACVSGNVELVKALVDKKADVGSRDDEGKLAVDLVNELSSVGKTLKAWLIGREV